MSRVLRKLMHDTVLPLQGANLSIDGFLNQPAPWKNSVLGALCFSGEAITHPGHIDPDIPCLGVPMQLLDTGDTQCEVWRGDGELTQGQWGAIHYRHDAEVLFGVIVLDEAEFIADPYLVRFWNYIADINSASFGLERYRQFNLGRQDAFLAHGREIVGNVPAACALGFGQKDMTQAPLSIAFLAGRAAPISIENPRQISAYQYPKQYGARSPTFSRAGLVRLGQDEVLFISGTASIVGHATLHPGDVAAQTRETMTNIEAVLAEANRLTRQTRFDLASLHYKVYVRHATDLVPIRAELERIVGGALNAIYLQADVCRQDLLLEIEATAAHPVLMPDHSH